MNNLRVVAAVFFGIAAVVSFIRYGKSRNRGQLLIGIAFLFAGAVFGGLTVLDR